MKQNQRCVRASVAAILVVATCVLAAPLSAEPSQIETSAIDKAADTAAAQTDETLAKALIQEAETLSANAEEFERIHSEAIAAAYLERSAPIWIAPAGDMAKAEIAIAEMARADQYGLNANLLKIPKLPDSAPSTPDDIAKLDVAITKSALLYARHARGGRIVSPSTMLNSNLDRKAQLLDPKAVLANLITATDPAATLRDTHPKHPQFQRLRDAYVKALPANGGPPGAVAKRLRANMEMWRWMWDDLGELYVFNNIPEFMQYVVRDGKIIRTEKIVAGLIDKQSSIFSRQLKTVALRPKWRVPESIMVHEIWPSLIRGGGMMRQYGLQVETKDGKTLDWRQMNWAKEDVRKYNITQPPGPASRLGIVKFSFPSQHTIFMHDTTDKWMFAQKQRTLSHGCLRVQKPAELAEIILGYDKGWSPEKVRELIRSGPLNNEVEMEKKIPIHLVYFTAWVDDAGKLKTFADVYGHERRITQALDGDWDKIRKGRDHLAPVEPNFNPERLAAEPARRRNDNRQATAGDLINNVFGGGF